MDNRKYGIDVIKTIGVWLVPSLHFFLNYGFYSVPMIGLLKIPEEMIRWVSFSCIGLFLMSSGYLQCEKEPNKKFYTGIVHYVAVFAAYSIITAAFLSHNPIKTAFVTFLQTPGYFWYIGCFLALYCFFPFFNLLIKCFDTKQKFCTFLLLLIICISLPETVNNMPALFLPEKMLYLPNYWSESFPILYYFLGAFFRKYPVRIPKPVAAAIVGTTALAISCVDYVFSSGGVPHCYGGGYGGLPAVIITFSLFALFYDIDLKSRPFKRTFKFISSITLEIYLGLAISDKITKDFITALSSGDSFSFADYFYEVPLNFFFSFILAVIISAVITACCRLAKTIGGGNIGKQIAEKKR